MDKRSKLARRIRLDAIVKAIGKRFSGPLQLAGHAYTPQSLVRLFQDEIDTIDRVDAADAARTAAVARHRAVKARNHPLHRALEGYVRALFGNSAEALEEFGYERLKQGKKTVETKALAAEKGRATRTARHTMGKKQRKTVRGKA